jgi:threonine aldolase
MGNLIAILAHCQRGDEMILGAAAHTFKYEVGGASALGGVHPHTVPIQTDGTLALDDIRGAIRGPNVHYPPSRLICLENTNGSVVGAPLTAAYTRSVRALADEYGLKVHLDGARIWNAAAALDCNVRDLTAPVDSVSFCLSKGLCAPVGSVLCGPGAFVERARRIRTMLGGGMRQAGVLAAAGIIAIEEMTQRLGEDHANARRLAEGLAQISGIRLNLEMVRTNMVFIELDKSVALDAQSMYTRLEQEYNVKLNVTGPRSFRLVTHYWITPERVDIALRAIQQVVEQAR